MEQNFPNLPNNVHRIFQHPTFSLSPHHLLSITKGKILPIETLFKPPTLSPFSSVKSRPRFRLLMFKKSKSMASHGKTGETEFNGLFVGGSKNKKHGGKLFTVKFKLEEAANMSIFTRKNSLRKEDDSSKRFSLEVIQKYLKLIKPLYIKVSKRQSEKMKQTEEFSCVSASSSPAGSLKKEKQGNIPAGIRVVCRQLGKSKSASATTGFIPATASSSSSSSRRDDSLLLQHDGIQSAILHCKNSFNSSRDSSVSSGSARDPTMISPRISNEATAIY